MTTLIEDPFKDDAAMILEWAYGVDARVVFNNAVSYGQQRAGQAFMNVLRAYDPVEHARLSGSLVDPFYEDSNLQAAIDMLTSK